MTNVGNALRRKLGPLPVWAWALIAGGALYLYRQRSSRGAANVPSAIAPDVTDSTQLPAGQVLQPGETYVPPGYGSPLTGGASDQTTGPDATTPADTSSDGGSGPDQGPASSPTRGKRRPKPKAHKAQSTGKPHGARSKRPRAAGILGRVAGRAAGRARARASSRPRSSAHKTAAPSRGRATPPTGTALRQRPAAPLIVHHETQQVQRHPERSAPAASRAPVAAPAPRRAPARPTRRRG